jgi:hypothetical protein
MKRSKFSLSRQKYEGGSARVRCTVSEVQTLRMYSTSSRKDLTEGKVELGREI